VLFQLSSALTLNFNWLVFASEMAGGIIASVCDFPLKLSKWPRIWLCASECSRAAHNSLLFDLPALPANEVHGHQYATYVCA